MTANWWMTFQQSLGSAEKEKASNETDTYINHIYIYIHMQLSKIRYVYMHTLQIIYNHVFQLNYT